MIDPVLDNDWHPVASTVLAAGQVIAARLLDRDLAVWRSENGTLHAWEDRCPHRGTRLSMGSVIGDELACAYHGWRYGGEGRCTLIPAQPSQKIPDRACVRTYHVAERYGLVWVCVGTPAGTVLPFAEHDDAALRKVVCGPYEVATSAPRIIENFLDMAHFGHVHEGILGDRMHVEMADYELAETPGCEAHAILATRCRAWQPQTNSLAHGGSDVEYTYRVVRPLTAILTKMPERQTGFREAISLHVQPLAEEMSCAWMVLALTNFEQEENAVRAFQDRIFLQDRPILESQTPRRLPISPGAELSIRCDRMSVAYRRYLVGIGLRYGVDLVSMPRPVDARPAASGRDVSHAVATMGDLCQ